MAEPGPIDGDPNCLARHAHFAVVLDWWQAIRARLGRLPTRRDIDPIALKTALSLLLIAEIHPTGARGAPRVRLRLVGTAINEMYEMGELTGRYLDQITLPAEQAALGEAIARVVRSGVPDCRSRNATRPSDRRLVSWDRLAVPLAPLPGEPPMVLVAVGPLTVRNPPRRGRGQPA